MILRSLTATILLVGLSSAALAATKASRVTLRDQEQAACYNDATTLCKDAVPDEQKIEACMRAKFSQVSAGCKKFFK